MQKKNTKIIRARKAPALPYGFQQKLKSVTSPEDILRLARELAARGAFQQQPVMEDEEIEEDPFEDEYEEEFEEPQPKIRSNSSTKSLVVRATTPAPEEPEAPSYTRAPWYEHGMGDTEAMVIDLYAKGLTTRDIVNHRRSKYSKAISTKSTTASPSKMERPSAQTPLPHTNLVS